MSKPTFSIFTAQDARNIEVQESSHNLGHIIDAIRAGAKQGYDSMNIAGANIDDEILDTLKERGFDVSETSISWAILPQKATITPIVVEESEDIDNEPSAESEEEE